MNDERRKEIGSVKEQLEELKTTIEGIKDDLDGPKEAEQEYFDNMPESLQGGEKGEKAQAAIDAMEEAISALEELDSTIDAIIQHLDTACE